MIFITGRYIDPLSWSVRLKIAAGFAKGLAYLHSPEVNVIYRELNSTKIFLDSVRFIIFIKYYINTFVWFIYNSDFFLFPELECKALYEVLGGEWPFR